MISRPRLGSLLRPTIRVRLTMLYGALFLIAGVVLLGVTYVLVRHNLDHDGVGAQLSAAGDTGTAAGAGGVDLAARGAQPLPGTRSGQVDPGQAVTMQNGAVLFARAARNLRADTLQSVLTQGALALGLVAVVAVAFGYLMAERVLRPLHRITETARRVSGGSLAFGGGPSERIDLPGPDDEIKELADTFDDMLERLARAFDGQSRFVANASHELRTPLAINRTLVEVAMRRRDAAEDTLRLGEALLVVNARHERLIDGLLTLARGDVAVVNRVGVDLHDVAAHVLVQCQPEAEAAGVQVSSELVAAPTSGDGVLLERLVQNLVENAIRHNRSGGWLSVTTTRAPTGEAVLTVANTGVVVAPYEITSLFEPFRRLHVDRVGSDRGAGLGLSIVQAVARSHRGALQAVPREGGGLVVTVRLPAAPAAEPPSALPRTG